MSVPNPIERKSGGGAAGVSEVLWTFAGTISTDQNGNIPGYVARRAFSLASFFVNFKTAGTGGDVVVNFLVNGLVVATVTVLDGQTEGTVDQDVDIVDGDVITVEIDSMTTSVAPTTMTAQAV